MSLLARFVESTIDAARATFEVIALPAAKGASGFLLAASIQAALVIALLWLICRLFPRIPASVRSGLWWLASLKLLLGLLPIPSLSVPAPVDRPRTEIVRTIGQPITQWADKLSFRESASGVSTSNPNVTHRAKTSGAQAYATKSPYASSRGSKLALLRARAAQLPWLAIGMGIWGLGALVGILGLRRHLAAQHRLLRGAVEWDDHGARAMLRTLSSAIGLRRTPRLLLSSAVDTPLVTGLLDPVVLVPERLAEELSPSERAMTLCHELVHVRRHDLLLGWVPALAERIFWFHPLARLATREYALAREAACDAEVIRLLEEAPQDYGRMLVRLGTARWPGLATAGVAPTTRTLRRRLLMLQHAGSPSPRRLISGAALALALLALVPLRFKDQPRAGLRVEPGPPEVVRDDEPKSAHGFYAVTPEPSVTEARNRAGAWGHLRAIDSEDLSEKPSDCAPCAPCEPKAGSWGGDATSAFETLEEVDAADDGSSPRVIDLSRGQQLAYAYRVDRAGSPVTVWAPPATPSPRIVATPYAVAAPVAPIAPANARELNARIRELTQQLRALSDARGGIAGSSKEAQELAEALAAHGMNFSELAQLGSVANLAPLADLGQLGNISIYTDDSDHAYVLMKGDTLTCAHGDSDDFRRARRLLRRGDADQILYFRDGNDEYVIDDPDFLEESWRLFDDDSETSRAQRELGAKQADLGAEQAELGRQQAELALKQAEMGVRVAQLQAEIMRREMNDQSTRELERNIENLQDQMNELGDQQSELGDRQSELGERQSEIGQQQSELGDRQSKDSEKRDERFWDRLEDAKKSGIAREVK